MADLAFILHTHMPYVRRNGDWPVGEEWILEAWAESYLPVWSLVEDLSDGRLPGKIALTMTPVLAEQLRDPYLEERLAGYLRNKVRQAREEAARLRGMGDAPREALASRFAEAYRGLLRDFESRFRGKMMETLRRGMESGRVEVLASAATHAHLPSLPTERCRRAQVELGLESYRRCFGREPAGFWLPECSYTPELDPLLSAFSPPLTYAVLDHSALEAAPRDTRTADPGRLGKTPLLALVRDRLAHDLVWTMRGYPSHGDYRDYAKRDHGGHGFQYWRVTSRDTPIDDKDVYHPERAAQAAREDARDFVAALRRRGEAIASEGGNAGAAAIVAAYDTELLGHWWLEGPLWLREVLSLCGGETELPRRVAEKARGAPAAVLSPPITAWNVDGTFSTWVNPDTEDMWRELRRVEEEFLALVDGAAPADGREKRALAQAAREMLILEGSDWPFMVTREQAAQYARDRCATHLARFEAARDMIARGKIDIAVLSEMEETDNLFPWLDGAVSSIYGAR